MSLWYMLQRLLPSGLAVFLFFLAGAVPAKGMELEGKVSYAYPFQVANVYAGTCTQVLKNVGDEVAEGEVLGYYRLNADARNEINEALNDGPLQQKKAEQHVIEARLAEAQLKVDRLRDAVQAEVASQASLDVALAELDLLRTTLEVNRNQVRYLADKLRDERAQRSLDLGGLEVVRGDVPEEIPLRAPMAGVLIERQARPGQPLAAGSRCFRVARKTLYVKCQVYAEQYVQLTRGMSAEVRIPEYPDRTWEAKLNILPLTAVDKGYVELSYYEIYFAIPNPGIFVQEGLRATVTLDAAPAPTASDN